jgi:hypothetical protein
MKRSISPRLRAPGLFAAGTLVVLAVGGATHGWSSLADVVPIPLIILVALYAIGGRETDSGALIRRQLDERQAYDRLKVQALVGRVLSLAVATAYTIAVATKASLWPWAILLGLMTISFVTGRLLYGDRDSHQADQDEV